MKQRNSCIQTRDGKFHCTYQTCLCLGYKPAKGMCGGNCEYFVIDGKMHSCVSKKARIDCVTVAIEFGQKYLDEVK